MSIKNFALFLLLLLGLTMAQSTMSDLIIHDDKTGQQEVSTIRWNGGYAFTAAASYIFGFIFLILGHLFRRVWLNKSSKWKYINAAIQYASLPAIIGVVFAFLFVGMGATLCYAGWFGPADMVSLHVDKDALGAGTLANWFVVNALPMKGNNNFYPWYFPVAAVFFSLVPLTMGCAYFNRLEIESVLAFGGGAFFIAFMDYLTFVSLNFTGWYVYIIGSVLFMAFNSFMLWSYREAIGWGTGIASVVPFIYGSAILILAAVGSYSAHLYYADVIYIWLSAVLPTLLIFIGATFLFLGAHVTPNNTTMKTKGINAEVPAAGMVQSFIVSTN